MSKKKLNLELDLRKKACTEPFAMKQQATGVFIEGFANKATIDRGDEIISTDAWELDNFKRNPIILFNHGMDTLGGTPVGKATLVNPTDDGLFLKVKMSNSQAPGIKMVRELVEERILKAFSVGFNPIESDTIDVDGKSVRKIDKAELYEVSIVGVPMNQDSLFELSEKALTTKSLHELKGDILKAKGATEAEKIEKMLGACKSRRDAMKIVAKSKNIELPELLDMLAGDAEIPAEVTAAFESAVKAVDLKEALEEALVKVNEGTADVDVIASLIEKLKAEDMEDEDEDPDKDKEEGGESDEEDPEKDDEDKAESEEDGEADKEDEDEADGEAGGEGKAEEDNGSEDGDPEDDQRKADFQDCVNGKIPALLEEGMEQDEAVAAAIAQCQEDGKCQLTPESKQEVFAQVFEAADNGWKELETLTGLEFVVEEKAVDSETQEEQPPTTPIKTEPNEDNFGSPYLEASKQTNVLLGALINEFQKFTSVLGSLIEKNSVSSNSEDPDKGTEESSDSEDEKRLSEEHAEKRLDALNSRLKSLGF